MFKRLIASLIILTFSCTTITIPQARAAENLNLPTPGTMVNLSPAFEPTLIKGLTVHKDNPFLFDFVVDTGHSGLQGKELKKEGDRLVKYFFAALTVPEKDLWVNLSPYEKDRMVPEALGKTALGRDLLAQDYILKQLTASLIYPEKDLGKEFWDRVYAKAQAMYGNAQIPVNTFNKVWILADKATVYEHGQTAFVVGGHLKVMLEEDYLAMNKHINTSKDKTNNIGSQLVREIVLPEIEKEVNTGKNFSTLRQIFNAQILATWYKKNLKEALLNQVYTDKNTVKGVNLSDPSVKEQIYQQYLKAYKKGVFNYIKEDAQANGQSVPRKYFSGGYGVNPSMLSVTHDSDKASVAARPTGTDFAMEVMLDINRQPDSAMASKRWLDAETGIALIVIASLLGWTGYTFVQDHKQRSILTENSRAWASKQGLSNHNFTVYPVRKSDTIASIVALTGIKEDILKEANNLTNDKDLLGRQGLILPGITYYNINISDHNETAKEIAAMVYGTSESAFRVSVEHYEEGEIYPHGNPVLGKIPGEDAIHASGYYTESELKRLKEEVIPNLLTGKEGLLRLKMRDDKPIPPPVKPDGAMTSEKKQSSDAAMLSEIRNFKELIDQQYQLALEIKLKADDKSNIVLNNFRKALNQLRESLSFVLTEVNGDINVLLASHLVQAITTFRGSDSVIAIQGAYDNDLADLIQPMLAEILPQADDLKRLIEFSKIPEAPVTGVTSDAAMLSTQGIPESILIDYLQKASNQAPAEFTSVDFLNRILVTVGVSSKREYKEEFLNSLLQLGIVVKQTGLLVDKNVLVNLVSQIREHRSPVIAKIKGLGILIDLLKAIGEQSEKDKKMAFLNKSLKKMTMLLEGEKLLDALAALKPFVLANIPIEEDNINAIIRNLNNDIQSEDHINRLDISTRTKNTLENNGVLSIRQISLMSDDELLSLTDIGRTSVQEIRSARIKQGAENIENQNTGLLDTPLSNLDLSVRARKIFELLNLRTLGDLIKQSREDLNKAKFTPNDFYFLDDELRDRGLRLGGYSFRKIDPDTDKQFKKTLDKPITDLELSVRASTLLEDNGIKTVRDLVKATYRQLLQSRSLAHGRLPLKTIEDQLEKLGLALDSNALERIDFQKPQEINPPPIAFPADSQLGINLRSPILDLDLPPALKVLLNKNKIFIVNDLVYKSESDLEKLGVNKRYNMRRIKRELRRMYLKLGGYYIDRHFDDLNTDQQFKAILDKSVQDLIKDGTFILSKRVLNALQGKGVVTVRDIIDKLYDIQGFGAISQDEIEDNLNKLGLTSDRWTLKKIQPQNPRGLTQEENSGSLNSPVNPDLELKLRTSISDLGLSPYLKNLLTSKQILSAKDLVYKSRSDLESIGVGSVSRDTIQSKLRGMELMLGGYILRKINADTDEQFKDILDKDILDEGVGLPTRATNALEGNKVRTVRDLVKKTPREIIALWNIGADTLNEIEAKLAKLGLALNSYALEKLPSDAAMLNTGISIANTMVREGWNLVERKGNYSFNLSGVGENYTNFSINQKTREWSFAYNSSNPDFYHYWHTQLSWSEGILKFEFTDNQHRSEKNISQTIEVKDLNKNPLVDIYDMRDSNGRSIIVLKDEVVRELSSQLKPELKYLIIDDVTKAINSTFSPVIAESDYKRTLPSQKMPGLMLRQVSKIRDLFSKDLTYEEGPTATAIKESIQYGWLYQSYHDYILGLINQIEQVLRQEQFSRGQLFRYLNTLRRVLEGTYDGYEMRMEQEKRDIFKKLSPAERNFPLIAREVNTPFSNQITEELNNLLKILEDSKGSDAAMGSSFIKTKIEELGLKPGDRIRIDWLRHVSLPGMDMGNIRSGFVPRSANVEFVSYSTWDEGREGDVVVKFDGEKDKTTFKFGYSSARDTHLTDLDKVSTEQKAAADGAMTVNMNVKRPQFSSFLGNITNTLAYFLRLHNEIPITISLGDQKIDRKTSTEDIRKFLEAAFDKTVQVNIAGDDQSYNYVRGELLQDVNSILIGHPRYTILQNDQQIVLDRSKGDIKTLLPELLEIERQIKVVIEFTQKNRMYVLSSEDGDALAAVGFADHPTIGNLLSSSEDLNFVITVRDYGKEADYRNAEGMNRVLEVLEPFRVVNSPSDGAMVVTRKIKSSKTPMHTSLRAKKGEDLTDFAHRMLDEYRRLAEGRVNTVNVYVVGTINGVSLQADDRTVNTNDLYRQYSNAIREDNAMKVEPPGGIDLNSANMGLTVTKDATGGVQVNFDPAMIERIKTQGVFSADPIIIRITPMTPAAIRPLLGLAPAREEDQLAKV